MQYDVRGRLIRFELTNEGSREADVVIRANAYRSDGPWHMIVGSHGRLVKKWPLVESHNWYDFTVSGEGFSRRFAGRMETGDHGISDPFA